MFDDLDEAITKAKETHQKNDATSIVVDLNRLEHVYKVGWDDYYLNRSVEDKGWLVP